MKVLKAGLPGSKLFVALRTRVGSVTEVQVLVFHEDVLVAEAAMTNVTFVGLLPHVSEADVPHQTILVAKVLVAQRTLVGACK